MQFRPISPSPPEEDDPRDFGFGPACALSHGRPPAFVDPAGGVFEPGGRRPHRGPALADGISERSHFRLRRYRVGGQVAGLELITLELRALIAGLRRGRWVPRRRTWRHGRVRTNGSPRRSRRPRRPPATAASSCRRPNTPRSRRGGRDHAAVSPGLAAVLDATMLGTSLASRTIMSVISRPVRFGMSYISSGRSLDSAIARKSAPGPTGRGGCRTDSHQDAGTPSWRPAG